jgi:hypothetical protein
MSHPVPASLHRIAAAGGCGSAAILLVNAARRAEVNPNIGRHSAGERGRVHCHSVGRAPDSARDGLSGFGGQSGLVLQVGARRRLDPACPARAVDGGDPACSPLTAAATAHPGSPLTCRMRAGGSV